ncbi:MAG: TraR/DksA C4-type zinc finger protein [bacterium]
MLIAKSKKTTGAVSGDAPKKEKTAHKAYKVYTPGEKERIIADIKNGASFEEIEKKYGISRQTYVRRRKEVQAGQVLKAENKKNLDNKKSIRDKSTHGDGISKAKKNEYDFAGAEKTNSGSPEGLKGKLLMLRKTILSNSISDILKKSEDGAGEPGDDADKSSSSATREVSYSMGNMNGTAIKEIDRALEKIEEGTYGICEDCGEPIPPKRLQLIPYCNYCVSCQEDIEKETARQKQNGADEQDFFGNINDDTAAKVAEAD